jgi:hypothetical protein
MPIRIASWTSIRTYQNAPQGGVGANSYPAYLDMAEYTNVFASTTAVAIPGGVSYLDQGALRTAFAEYTTVTYLSVLGLRPSLGRWFTATEDTLGGEVVAVLGHHAWIRRFRADPSVRSRRCVAMAGRDYRTHAGSR